ncbi:MAG: hypothetical protein ABJD07_11055 [Gemmatimonadaceae bacterium]
MSQRGREIGWLIVGPNGPFEEVDAALLGRASLLYPLPRNDLPFTRVPVADTPPTRYVRSPIRVDGERVWIYALEGESSLDLFDAIEHVRRLVRMSAPAQAGGGTPGASEDLRR